MMSYTTSRDTIGSLAEYQRAHTANMAKIDYWMAEMKKNRDAEAIRLGGLLKQPE